MRIKIDTAKDIIQDIIAAWHLLGALIEQHDPDYFADTPPTPEPEPDFAPEDNMPPDHIDGPQAPTPVPSNVVPLPLPPPSSLFPPSPTPSASTATAPAIFTASPASAPAAVLPPMPPPPGPAPAPDLDSAGVAYDMNLHSSTRSKTIDGKWKARRVRGGAQVPAATTAPLPPPVVDNASTFRHDGSPWPKPLTPPVIPPPMVAPPPADNPVVVGQLPPSANAGIDFPTFIGKVTAAMTANTLTQARIAEVMAQFQLDGLFSLNSRPELVSPVAVALGF